MYNLLNIYDCPKCGKVLSDEVTHGESIDTERDKVYEMCVCNKCGNSVEVRRTWNEEDKYWIYSYEEVDDERARWANGFYDENEDDEDEYWERTCPGCGGTIAEDYSTCFCDEDEETVSPQKMLFDNDPNDLPF